MFASVIVPVYNSEKYIDQCIGSIIEQDHDSFEVILVDDGSSDSSYDRCLQFAESDARIRCFQQEHGGASKARNRGVEEAQGEYVFFCDNDDFWIRSDALALVEERLRAYRYPDVAVFPIGSYYEADGRYDMGEYPAGDGVNKIGDFEATMSRMLDLGLYYSSACAKAVRRDLLRDNAIVFDESLVANEDTDWSRQVLGCINSIIWIEEPFYAWRRASDVSQSSKPVTDKTVRDLRTILLKHFNSSAVGSNSAYVDAFMSYIFLIYLAYLYMVDGRLVKCERNEARNWQRLLRAGKSGKVRLAYMMSRFAGLAVTGRALAMVMLRERSRVARAARKVKVQAPSGR